MHNIQGGDWTPSIYQGGHDFGGQSNSNNSLSRVSDSLSPELLALGEEFVLEWDDDEDNSVICSNRSSGRNSATSAVTDMKKRSKKKLNGTVSSATSEDGLPHNSIHDGSEEEFENIFPGQVDRYLQENDEPSPIRLRIVSVTTVSADGKPNSTVIDSVNAVYDFIQRGTSNDSRISYQTICLSRDNVSFSVNSLACVM